MFWIVFANSSSARFCSSAARAAMNMPVAITAPNPIIIAPARVNPAPIRWLRCSTVCNDRSADRPTFWNSPIAWAPFAVMMIARRSVRATVVASLQHHFTDQQVQIPDPLRVHLRRRPDERLTGERHEVVGDSPDTLEHEGGSVVELDDSPLPKGDGFTSYWSRAPMISLAVCASTRSSAASTVSPSR